MKAFVTVLLLCLVAVQAGAQEPAGTCPPVYGRWRTAYVMDKFGVPQPLEPPGGRPGLIMEARIEQKKAVLIWHGGKKKMTFKRWYKFEQNDYEFGALARNGEYIEASTRLESAIKYPTDKCYVWIWYSLKSDGVGTMQQHLLMEKVK